MSTARFQYCLKVVLGNEGGYVNHKDDRGGATNFGVTQKTYDDFCKLTGREPKPVAEITEEEVERIYGGYWKDAHCSYMPEPLDLLMLDAAINHGAKRANKLLQRTLGVDEDGIIGRGTMDALHEEVIAVDVHQICDQYLDNRSDYFHEIVEKDPKQGVFLKGWLARVEHLRDLV